MKTLLVFAALLACALAEVATFRQCEDSSIDVCEINEIRIDPCKDKKACKFKKGHRASINFDFTPKFSASKMTTSLYWASDGGDVPFLEMKNADACQFTECPVVDGKKQELKYSLKVAKKLPSGKFTFKWKLVNEENPSQLCCFKTEVVLRK